MKGELTGVAEASPSESYARLGYHPECEAAVNQQINVEYNISYIYHSLWAFFARDNVGAALKLTAAAPGWHPLPAKHASVSRPGVRSSPVEGREVR